MAVIQQLVGAVLYVGSIIFAGVSLVFLYDAVTLPFRFDLSAASAIQVTQVYTEGTYTAVMVVALMSVALFGLIAGSRVMGSIQQGGQTGE